MRLPPRIKTDGGVAKDDPHSGIYAHTIALFYFRGVLLIYDDDPGSRLYVLVSSARDLKLSEKPFCCLRRYSACLLIVHAGEPFFRHASNVRSDGSSVIGPSKYGVVCSLGSIHVYSDLTRVFADLRNRYAARDLLTR